MSDRNMVVGLLISLIGATGYAQSSVPQVGWLVFLYGLPLGLIGCVLAHQRWAFMGAVMYGTIGLALDISTVVQGLTKPDVPQTVLMTSGLTGLLNFLLIVFGGKGFLNLSGILSPPQSPRPNPPSPSSS